MRLENVLFFGFSGYGIGTGCTNRAMKYIECFHAIAVNGHIAEIFPQVHIRQSCNTGRRFRKRSAVIRFLSASSPDRKRHRADCQCAFFQLDIDKMVRYIFTVFITDHIIINHIFAGTHVPLRAFCSNFNGKPFRQSLHKNI